MKKIILVDRVKQGIDAGFFEELADLEFLTAYSNEDALRIHRRERAAVIVTELYGSGMNARQLCDLLRQDADARSVSVIVCCRDNEIERAEAALCKANVVLTMPLGRAVIRRRVREFLDVSVRGSIQVPFSASRLGSSLRTPIDCRTRNISVTGMLIEADADLNRGETLQCSLSLPSAASFVTKAEVVRIAEARTPRAKACYGVRFAGLGPQARRAIELIVSGPAGPC
jgi:CheY-like chemotaxis protein